MWLLLNVAKLETASVYAVSSDKNDKHYKGAWCVKIAHMPIYANMVEFDTPSMVTGEKTFLQYLESHSDQLPEMRDDYTFIIFHSDMPFREFCTKFAASEYNDRDKYDQFNHNCAHAAHHALKLAGIHIPIEKSVRARILLTPALLYEYAKAYKIKLLNQSTSSYGMLLSELKNKNDNLIEAAKWHQQSPEIKNTATTIKGQIEKLALKKPHHIELYLEVLTRGIELLINSLDFAENSNESALYVNLSERFKEKSTSPYPQLIKQAFILIVGYLMCQATAQLPMRSFLAIEDSTSTESSPVTNIINIIFLGLAALLSNKFINAALYYKKEIKPTPLSEAMKHLAENVRQIDDDTIQSESAFASPKLK